MNRIVGATAFALMFATSAFANKVKIELSKQAADTVTYEKIKPILQTSCIGCHGPTSRTGLNLTVFPFVSTTMTDQNVIMDKILVRVVDTAKPMPPKNKTPLTQAEIDQLQAFKDAGMPTVAKSIFVTKISVLDATDAVLKEETHTNDADPFDVPSVLEMELP